MRDVGSGGIAPAQHVTEVAPSATREPAVADFAVEVDFLGYGAWQKYTSIRIPSGEYKYHVFPSGFSAHWVRLKSNRDCQATAQFFYT